MIPPRGSSADLSGDAQVFDKHGKRLVIAAVRAVASGDAQGFRKAIEATGRKNIIMTGLWTEVCVTWPTIEMLGAGYNIYVVEDCCGATSPDAQEAALSG